MDLELASNVLGDDQDLGLTWQHKSCSRNTKVVPGTQKLFWEHKGCSRDTKANIGLGKQIQLLESGTVLEHRKNSIRT